MNQTKFNFFLLIILIIACFIDFSQNTYAGEFQSMGHYAISMGGAGVASSSTSFGTYYNPAILSHHKTGLEFIIGIGLGVREINMVDHIDTLSDIKVYDTLDYIEEVVNSKGIADLGLNLMVNNALNPKDQESIKIIKNELRALSKENGLQIMPGLSLGLQVGNLNHLKRKSF